MILQRSHLVIGALFLAIFLLTGVYMFVNFPDLYQGREEVRMMFRATHIYILMAALINILCGTSNVGQCRASFAWLSSVASVLIMLAPVLFVTGFAIEPTEYRLDRPVSFWGVVALLTGVLLRAILCSRWLAVEK
jgi:uncharacterized membrane protein YwaF